MYCNSVDESATVRCFLIHQLIKLLMMAKTKSLMIFGSIGIREPLYICNTVSRERKAMNLSRVE
ncbi:hypothetical protein Plhal304r1_c011g0044151 [Plasmopara halstedii]